MSITTLETTVETAPLETETELAARFSREAEPLFGVLLRGAKRLSRCDADAEDLLQDTLLHGYTGFRTFEEGTNLRAWLFRIMYNRWVSTYRVKQRRPAEVSVDEVTERDLADSAARSPGAARSAEAEALDTIPDHDVRAALRALPDGFRMAVYYADVQGHTYAETAVLLGIPMGTVMSRVSRGRKRLRISLSHLADRRDVSAAHQRVA